METRANFVLIGLFTLAVIASAFGFVYWFSNIGTGRDRATYQVVFNSSVTGLRTGSSVLFNGIRVGEVSELKLNSTAPSEVTAVISIAKSAAIRSDTWVGLDYHGLTGNASVSLRGGSTLAPPPASNVLKADSAAGNDVSTAAREVLRKLDTMISDNTAVLRVSLKNIETFSQTLADNSDRIDRIMAGAEKLMGDGDKPGEFARAARAIREAAENLDKRTERLTTDGRRTLSALERAIKNIDNNPSRLLFGGAAPEAGTVRR
jgi:phospholipid/cholesterol/gamma-HCH transport system substrate-binding protein